MEKSAKYTTGDTNLMNINRRMQEDEHLKEHNNVPDKTCESCREIVFHRLSHAMGDAFEDMSVGDVLDFLTATTATVFSYVPLENRHDAFGEFVKNMALELADQETKEEEGSEEEGLDENDPDTGLLN